MRLQQLAINDEGFIFDPTTGESFTVNESGLFILRGLKSGKTSAEIVEALQSEFENTPESAERDVLDFISHLKAFHLY